MRRKKEKLKNNNTLHIFKYSHTFVFDKLIKQRREKFKYV